MAIYCNVEKCVSWESIDTPMQQTHGIGYVPIGGLGLYKGKCKLNSVSVQPKTIKTRNGRFQVLSICSNFSEEHSAEVEPGSAICSKDDCLHNKDTGDGLICMRYSAPNKDLFFDADETYDGDVNAKVMYPVCKSYSVRHRTGVIDWSRVYDTS